MPYYFEYCVFTSFVLGKQTKLMVSETKSNRYLLKNYSGNISFRRFTSQTKIKRKIYFARVILKLESTPNELSFECDQLHGILRDQPERQKINFAKEFV